MFLPIKLTPSTQTTTGVSHLHQITRALLILSNGVFYSKADKKWW